MKLVNAGYNKRLNIFFIENDDYIETLDKDEFYKLLKIMNNTWISYLNEGKQW